MGGVCGKPSSPVQNRRDRQKRSEFTKGTTVASRPLRAVSSKREESFRVKDKLVTGDVKLGLVDRKSNGSRKVRDDHYEQIKEKLGLIVNGCPVNGVVPKALEGELIAAGWPSWLSSVAGEAINGWLPRKVDTFEKLDKIGQGTYSSVYKARDLINNKLVALKRVRFDNMDIESVKFMAREIVILRKLDHPNIIKLEGLVASRSSCSLYLVFEYMEHDLTGLASLPDNRFTEPQMKCYMHQLLSGLDHCHSRGVLHRDIKGSNLLIDNNGILKIADFGLATFFDPHQSVPLTSRVVTLWYRPPELLLGASHYGVAVDLWSTGCILGELYAGKPIMPGRTEVEQLHKIFKLCGSPSENYWIYVVYWGIDVTEAGNGLVKELGGKQFCFVELRTLMVATDWENASSMGQLAIAGHARSLLEWHTASRFCGFCGGKNILIDAGRRKQCSNELCKKKIYPRVDPVVIMLVIDKENDRALLSRQSRFVPRMWSCLAGFMEPGESLEEAVRRETWEETGIEVGQVVYHSSQPWPVGPSSMPCQLMVGFFAYAKSLDINVDKEELEDAKWHSREVVKKALTIAEYKKAQKTACGKVDQMCKGVERGQSLSSDFNVESGELAPMFIPGPFAIANHLISSWVNGVESQLASSFSNL